MSLKPLRTEPRRRRPRGQALVITALMALVITLVVMLTFATGYRTREKIKLQATADAAAYSLAVSEARAMNFWAWSNRAIISHYVSILSIHSHQSYLSWLMHAVKDTADNYDQIALSLAAQCARPWRPCRDACRAVEPAHRVARLFNDEYDRMAETYMPPGAHNWWRELVWRHANEISGIDNAMALASRTHLQIAYTIRRQQESIHRDLINNKIASQGLAAELARLTDPAIQPYSPESVGELNRRALVADNEGGDGPVSRWPSHEDFVEVLAGTRYPSWLYKRGFFYTKNIRNLEQQAREIAASVGDSTSMSFFNEGNSLTTTDVDYYVGFGDLPKLRERINRPGGNDPNASDSSRFGGMTGAGAKDQGRASASWRCSGCSASASRSGQQNGIYSDPNNPKFNHNGFKLSLFGFFDVYFPQINNHHGFHSYAGIVMHEDMPESHNTSVTEMLDGVSGHNIFEFPSWVDEGGSGHALGNCWPKNKNEWSVLTDEGQRIYADKWPIWDCGIAVGFMRYDPYRRNAEARLFMQPHVIAAVSKDLTRRQVWDFEFKASLPLPVRFSTLSQTEPMVAIGGALVYYHRPDSGSGENWREPPTLWNPFWRAKAHPIRFDDARAALEGHSSARLLEKAGEVALNY
ncbi:MAG: Tad domain-containing protein [Myxococcales bacterium]|jgi:hypothetical protein